MKRREFTLASVGAGVAALAGCSRVERLFGSSGDGPAHTGWTTFRGDTGRTGYRQRQAGSGESLSVDWEVTALELIDECEDDALDDVFPVLPRYTSWPVLGDDAVFWTTRYDWGGSGEQRSRTRLVAADPETGTIQWTVELTVDDALQEWYPPEGGDDELYVPEVLDGEFGVTVFDPATGDRVRELTLGLSSPMAVPVSSGGTLFVTTMEEDAMLFAFDADTGDELWTVETAPQHFATPFGSVADETLVYFDRTDDAFVGRDVTDGSERFRHPFDLPELLGREGTPILSPPVLGGDAAYAAGNLEAMLTTEVSPLVGFDPDDGREQFQYEPPGIEGEGNPVADRNPNISPAEAVQLPPFSAVYGHPVVVDDLIIATGYGSHDGTEGMHCFAVDADGELEWAVESGLSYAPVAAGDVVYLLSNEGVEALSTDGEYLDSLALRDETDAAGKIRMTTQYEFSPALGEGRLFVPAFGGMVAIG